MSSHEASAHVLLTGLIIGESPRGHEGRLWFCPWGEDEIVALDVDGNMEVFTGTALRPA